jgi:predicted MFS family arabinose efflux permease
MHDLPTWVATSSVLSLGLAAAAEVDLLAYLTSRFLGMKAYGRVYGCQLSVFYLGAALGPLLAGLAYDHFHGYAATLVTAAAVLGGGALIVGTLGRPPGFLGRPADAIMAA